MKTKDIIKKIKELSPAEEWNHQYNFPGDIHTRQIDVDSPGFNINKWKRLSPAIEALSPQGKAILDIGCSDGYFSIQCAMLGAKSVLGIDLDPLRVERSNFAKEIYDLKNIEFKVADLYELEDELKFDIVLGLGLIHRVPDIKLCLRQLANLGDNIVLEFKTLNSSESKCEYHGGKTKSNKYNGLHYIPTKKYVIDSMLKYGFDEYGIIEDKNSGLNYKRTIIIFSKKVINEE